MARWSAHLNEGQWIAFGYLGMALFSAIYSQVTSIPLAIALVMVVGFLNAPVSIARRLIVQRNTTREVRGRVMSTFMVTANVVFLFGMGAAGLADVINVRLLMLASALLTLTAGVLSLVLPGFGRPAAAWRQALLTLRTARAPVVGVWSAARNADFDRLARHQPLLAALDDAARAAFIEGGEVSTVHAGEIVLSHGEPGDEVYFILAGEAVAGVAADSGDYRSLSTMGPGDVFGEIAALMGTARTADVVAAQDLTTLKVPAENVRELMARPRLRYFFLSKLTERLDRTHIIDLPRLATLDQQALRELRQVPMVSA
jgi:CRP-like cAMP-binding protein